MKFMSKKKFLEILHRRRAFTYGALTGRWSLTASERADCLYYFAKEIKAGVLEI